MKFGSLRFTMTLTVLLINTVSALLTMLLILLLGQWQPLNFLMLPQAALISSLIIGTILSAVIYQWVLRPIDTLIRMTKQVSRGDFTVRADPKGSVGSVSELVASFNRMTEELGSVEMLKSDFINTFSHEFKTPIVSIRGFVKQLKRSDLSEKEREEYLDIILKESERLTTMSTNVLLLSRFENEQILSISRPFSLDEQLRDCILMLEKSWDAKQIEWDLELSTVTLRSDPAVIEHIWLNLLSNAIKFSPIHGKITVCCAEENGFAAVTVRDEGIGMTQEVADHIFEKFYQGDPSHSRQGNGLGLSIVKRITELAKGEISVVSEIGRGSTFRVLLPLEVDASTNNAPEAR